MSTNSTLVLERKIGDFEVDSVTDAPLQIEVQLELDVPQSKAFELVFRDIDSWFKQISGVQWNHSRSSSGSDNPGINSVRSCGFGKDRLYEDIVFYEPPRAYGYAINMNKSTASFPVENPLGVFLIDPAGDGNKSIITWRQYFNKKFHPVALILNPMFKNMLMKKNLKNLIKEYGGRFL